MSANTFLPPVLCVPGRLLISAITQTFPMVVTIVDSDLNTYAAGMNVHFTIPNTYKMFQLDQRTGTILLIDNLDFHIDIDARNFDAFVAPNPMDFPTPAQPASMASAGSQNIYNVTVAPFRSLNNEGN